ncbi:MAG: cryptochrome/photolyase family protein [Kofleriaceae bacterium]
MFVDDLRAARPTSSEIRARRWIYVPYDRLTADVGPLATASPRDTGLVFVESAAKARRRPYHKKKLALLLANERHFALEQAARGFKVMYLAGDHEIGDALIAAQLPHLVTMEPAERELRQDLRRVTIEYVPDDTWLTTAADFTDDPPYRMDVFYRGVRKRTGILVENGKPIGGKWSHDAENRKPWRGDRPVPIRPSFTPDAITREVLDLVETTFPDHFGSLAGFDLPTTARDAERVWTFARAQLLPWFGPWEDAMSTAHPDLFHTRVSGLVNLSRLLPRRLVADVRDDFVDGKLPIASAEGFIRQLLGWREYMRHIHRVTDGFRTNGMGNAPNALGCTQPLPPAYWGQRSGMNCLDTVVAQVLADGYSHHITRLMVLSNIASLAGVTPRALCDWFWFGYIDAYDWVVEPNVLGMSTYGDGGQMTTKPYISGAAYIHKMSDYCGGCALDSKRALGPGACPITAMYWTFLDRHQGRFADDHRMAMPIQALRKKPAAERAELAAYAEAAIETLARGGSLTA